MGVPVRESRRFFNFTHVSSKMKLRRSRRGKRRNNKIIEKRLNKRKV